MGKILFRLGYSILPHQKSRQFKKEVIELIKLFEIDSNLMTDMNTYLNNKP